MWNRLKTLDPLLYVLPLALSVVGVIVIYTLTNDSAGIGTALRQALFAAIGTALMLGLTFLDYRSLRPIGPWAYGIGMFLLLLVKLVGSSSFGAARWINIGPLQLQPSELFKDILIITLAAWLSRGARALDTRTFSGAVLIVLVPVIAVMAQPDLGTALVLVVSGLGMILHSRIERWHRFAVFGVVIAGVLAITLSYKGVPPFTHVLKPYQKGRIETFINPTANLKTDDAQTVAAKYHINQSMIAVGSGGLIGKGLGQGSQSQLNFLPVAQADFIFAAIAEAWGLVGSYAVIAVFATLAFRFLNAARIAKDDFGSLLCVGILIKLLFEIMVNIGMNIGKMPVTGIPLPFLSYGGTAMLSNFVLIGIAQSVVIRYKRLTFER
jgi:rod shape determining protein RodA